MTLLMSRELPEAMEPGMYSQRNGCEPFLERGTRSLENLFGDSLRLSKPDGRDRIRLKVLKVVK